MVVIIKGRQLELLLYLLNHKKTTYRQLAELFEVSTKTIERDIDQLAYAGIPIHCVQGNGGGVFIDEHYKLTKSFFTNEEIENIVFALSAYDSITGKAFKSSILKKLCLIAPELTALFNANARDYFIVDLVDEPIGMNSEVAEAINWGLEEEVLIALYLEGKRHLVAPISYVLKPNGMYLYCFENGYHMIQVAQIERCETTNQEFVRNFLPYGEATKNSL